MKEKSKEDAKQNVDPPYGLALDYERNKAGAALRGTMLDIRCMRRGQR
jgi:hypothetical protein